MPDRRLDRRTLIKTSGAAAAALALGGSAEGDEPPRVKLRLMVTTDLHVNIFPYDYYRDRDDDTVGLAKTASLVAEARAEAKNSLLFDNGDLIQGSPMGDYVAYEKGMKPGDVHPMVAAMNTLGYVCGTLGNHEFNYGLDFLTNSLREAGFPIVCANAFKADGSPLVEPTKVIEADVDDENGEARTLRIGIVGFVPPQIVQWDKGNLDGKVTTIDIVEAARRTVPDLAAACDLVVALCHSGIAGGERQGGEENAALHLAEVDGIDAIFTGHQHLIFPGPKDFQGIDGADTAKGSLHGKPAVMAGFWGSHLGVIDLDLTQTGGRWKVDGFHVEARPIYERDAQKKVVPTVDVTATVLAAVQDDHDATLAYVRRPVGETKAPVDSYFALVADDPSVQIVSQAQLWYGAMQAKAAGLPALPILSAAAPFKSGGRNGPDYFTDVKAGPIAIKDVADIYLYPNTIRIVKVTGAEVREWLERSAGIFNRIDPAATGEQMLIDPSFPAFNFDVIDGVTYRIDPTQPSRYDGDGKLADEAAHRILDLAYDGKPIEAAAEFLVVTNNYRAGGGGNFPGADGTTIVFEGPDTNRDVIVRWIVEEKAIDPKADGNWRLQPWPYDLNVVFVSSPRALDAAKPAGVSIEPAGDAPDGFSKYRLRLAS